MSIFAIGDLHLSLQSNKPMDIFGWTDHVARLESHWRKLVAPDDTVVLVGDTSWGMTLEEARSDFAFLHGLPGKKILIKGNHDYWWTTKKKMMDFFGAQGYYSLDILHNNAIPVETIAICGTRGWFFDAQEEGDRKVLLREVGRLQTSIRQGKQSGLEPVVFLHYPPLFENQICKEIYEVLVEEQIKTCYYGHLHGASTLKAFQGTRDGIRFSLLSCDHTGFSPVPVYASGP